MSEWKRDASAGDTSGWAPLIERLRRAEERLAALETRAPLSNASIGEGGLRVYGGGSVTVTDGGGITVEDDGNLAVDGDALVAGSLRSADFDGDLATGNVGTTGWAFDRARAAIGDLLLRPGSIGNDTLTSPVTATAHNPRAEGFGLTTTFVELAGSNLTVPAGFTRALVHMTGSLYARNPNNSGGADGTGTDALYVQIGALPGFGSFVYAVGVSGNGGFATTHADLSYTITDLTPGSTMRISIYGASAFRSIAADPGNRCNASASIVWLR